jgi:N4-gp56 family major capsid protein
MADQYQGVGNDIPNGIYELILGTLDVYSAEIEFKARGAMRYEECCVRKEDLLASKGTKVYFTEMNDITRGGRLSEGVPMERRSMSGSTKHVEIDEWGNAVGITGKLNLLSWRNVMMEQATALARDYRIVRDLSVRDTLTDGGSTIFPNPAAASLTDLTPDDVMDIETIRRVVEELSTANVPKFLDDFYIAYVHPHQTASLRRDPDWKSVSLYNNAGRNILRGEVGRFEDVVFIETTNQQNGRVTNPEAVQYDADLIDSGTTGDVALYRATFLGDQAVGLADALPVEMRIGQPEDFGRLLSTAWYGMWGVGILNDDGIIHVVTA